MEAELKKELESVLEKFQGVLDRTRSEPRTAEGIVPVIKALLALDERISKLESR